MQTPSPPAMYIQSDWNDLLWTPGREIWVSAKKLNEPSDIGHIKCTSITNENPKITSTNRFSVIKINRAIINVVHLPTNTNVTFIAPVGVFNLHQKSVQSLAVTCGGLGVSSCIGDKLFVWDSNNGNVLRNLTSHVSTVYRCRFFPSGVVILSAGADMGIKIWSAETGENPVTLKGHVRSVTDLAIIDKGRNIISVSWDGFAKLWDVGKSTCLANLLETNTDLNCCVVHTIDEEHNVNNEREVGTGNKILIVGDENGILYVLSVAERKIKFQITFPAAISACCVLDYSNIILVGTKNGELHKISLDSGAVVETLRESASVILYLTSYMSGWITAREDGSCVWQHETEPVSRISFSGPDCDGITDVSTDDNYVFTACKDGLIRKYNLKRFLN